MHTESTQHLPLQRAQPAILVVDDTPDNLALMSAVLRPHYMVKVAPNGEVALAIARQQRPELILLDVMMPGLDGYEVCRRLKADPDCAAIPVVFLTALTEPRDEERGFAAGALDYITKPISPPLLLARVRTQLQLKAARDLLADQNAYLEREVQRRIAEIERVQDVTIALLASLAETRDSDTGNHIRRTQHYVRELALQLAATPRYRDQLDERAIQQLFKSAPLHDIGKVGVPDAILLKPGPLTAGEFEIMKRHPTLGRDAIAAAERLLGDENSFLRFAREIAYSHQEKWDGSGYPQGLRGEQIPLSARLMSLADVYDALISRRVYKPALPHEQARKYIVDNAGCHFDPDVVAAFLRCEAQFIEIAGRYADAPAGLSEAAEEPPS